MNIIDGTVAFFNVMFYASLVLGYLLRWSWGEKNNLVLLFTILIAALPFAGKNLRKDWRSRLYFVMVIGTVVGLTAAQLSFFEFGQVGFIEFILTLPIVAILVYLPAVFLIRLPDTQNAWANTPITNETRHYRLATILAAIAAAGVWIIFMPFWDIPRSIMRWLVMGVPIVMTILFAARWKYEVGYHRGWQDGREGSVPRTGISIIPGGRKEKPQGTPNGGGAA